MYSCQDWAPWTCDECAEGGTAVGQLLSTPDAIWAQILILAEKMCPQTEDQEECNFLLEGFWISLAPFMWPLYFSHICDDRNCPPPPTLIKVNCFFFCGDGSRTKLLELAHIAKCSKVLGLSQFVLSPLKFFFENGLPSPILGRSQGLKIDNLFLVPTACVYHMCVRKRSWPLLKHTF